MGNVLKEAVDKGILKGNIQSISDSTSQTSQSKSGFAISGSVAVNVIDDHASAYILNSGAISLGSGNLTLNAVTRGPAYSSILTRRRTLSTTSRMTGRAREAPSSRTSQA